MTLNNANNSKATISSGSGGTTTLNATSTGSATLSYGGWNIDASTGSINSLTLENAAVTLSGTVKANYIELNGETITATSNSTIETYTLKVNSDADVSNNNGTKTENLKGTKAVATKDEVQALGDAMVAAAKDASALDATAVTAADEHVGNLSKDLFANTLPSASDLAIASKLDAYFAAKSSYETALDDLNSGEKNFCGIDGIECVRWR